MKRTIKLAVVAALALGATSAFATNGSTLMGVGAKSRGMGGVGIATGMGAESTLSNPALITTIKGNNEVSFGGTVFMPDIETNNNMVLSDGLGGYDMSQVGTQTSDSDFFVIPSVSLASKVNDNFYWGIGMWGTGGLGVDYRGDASHMDMVTALQTMQFGVPLAYTANGFSVGITPIVQYSSLDINYVMSSGLQNNMAAALGDPSFGITDDLSVGAGAAQDLSVGFNLGMAYETNGFTIGAVYKSEIKFNIDDQLSNAINPMIPMSPSGYTQDEMATPAEYGIGVSYTMQGHTIAVDYKNINWEDAEVYKDFGWEDQDVIAVGYEYATDGWALRAGYQYAESAVQDNTGKNLTLDSYGFDITNTFNMLGFPGTQESHISLGGTYAFNETISMDLAVVYGLENEEKMTNFLGQDITTKHSEQSYTVQLNYAF
ncbi:aromatic hydrocarbon degradation protein [Sulfurimonas crateris]|uniref:Aromatic hydrocarbon degradation protein n=1 Tax=Sulfurimonas crateris TaxID=2574727 RepID=A0A4V5TLP9_9BACT|nr:outer membrane protein transport protein [Sulfurimonas crateris]TKI68563.1 aromatic hydrocarbon degradation protein [Sulfurimonas crateris]